MTSECVVVVVLHADAAKIATLFLPPTPMRATALDRVYLVYRSSTPLPLEEFRDLTGDLIIGAHSFTSLEEARAWAERDAKQRRVTFAATEVLS